jgi:hypothetical protein
VRLRHARQGERYHSNSHRFVQAQVAAEASHTAEEAKQAVQDVLDSRARIVQENVDLEEQVLELKNAAAAAQQHRSELESCVASAAHDVAAEKARADAAAKRAEQDRRRLLDEIEELKEGRTALLMRMRDMTRGQNAADSPPGPADPPTHTENRNAASAAERSTREVADAACQCSDAWGDVNRARAQLGRNLSQRSSHGRSREILEEEVEQLQDPASLRVAEQASAALERRSNSSDSVAAGRDAVTGSVVPGKLEGWRALLPPVGRGSGVVAAVADTQVAVLESVHGLLDRVEQERVRARETIAAKTAEIELLRAAVVAAGGSLPQLSSSIEHGPTEASRDNGQQLPSIPQERSNGFAADTGGATATASAAAAAATAGKESHQSVSPRAVSSAAGLSGAAATAAAGENTNGMHAEASVIAAGGVAGGNSDSALHATSADAKQKTPRKHAGVSADEAGAPGSGVGATPSPARGWFGGMFRRSPSQKSPPPTLLNSA